MCEQFIGQYGFKPITNTVWGLYNGHIIPKLCRYYNNIWEIMAEARETPDRLFLFFFNSTEDRATDKFFADINKLTVEDSMSVEEIHSILRSRIQ